MGRKKGEGTLAYASRKLEEARKKPLSIKNAVVIMDPPQLAALRKEIQHHPQIVKELGSQMDDLPTTLGVLAAYVDIAMDGYYSHPELMHLCDLITKRLYERRTMLIIGK